MTSPTQATEVEEMISTVSFILPIRQVQWIASEALRVSQESGRRPNKSEVVRNAIDQAISTSQSQERAS